MKLSDEQVRLLRRCRQNEGMPPMSIYEMFCGAWSVSDQAIDLAIRGRTFKHLELPIYPEIDTKFKEGVGTQTTHGQSKTRLNRIWKNMRQRCRNEKRDNYSYYGGRGIQITPEWDSYESFHTWAMSNGYTDSLTLDRVDNDGDYEPSNCRWATKKQQANNRRVSTKPLGP